MNAPGEIKESIGGATRYQHRNGSDSPAIMRVSPWAGWKEVKESILGIRKFAGNIATRHGEQYEDEALAAALGHFCFTGQSQVRLINGDYAATLDFLSDDGKTILEIKCPFRGKSSKIWKSVNDFADPSYYVWQGHHQLLVAPDAQNHILFVYDADSKSFVWCEMVRNETAIETLKREWDAFYAWMAEGTPDASDGWIEGTSEFTEVARKYIDAKAKADKAAEEAEEYRKDLILLAEGDKVRGAGVTVVKSERKGTINYKAIPQLREVDLEQYRGKSTSVTTVTIEKE